MNPAYLFKPEIHLYTLDCDWFGGPRAFQIRVDVDYSPAWARPQVTVKTIEILHEQSGQYIDMTSWFSKKAIEQFVRLIEDDIEQQKPKEKQYDAEMDIDENDGPDAA